LEFRMCVPCLFGLEGLAADELRKMGLKDVMAENGKVLFTGGCEDVARVNIGLRTGERVLILVGQTKAPTFDALFEGVKAMEWENFIPVDGEFPVKGSSLNSALFSIPNCQKIIKKAIVERLKSKYKTDWFRETGARYQIRFSLMNDVAALYIDTSGQGLHKRGYRTVGNAAPLRETLAAAIVRVAKYRGRDAIFDPFCGSGTIPIEAALAAINRAPGINRKFESMNWAWMDKTVWTQALEEAKDKEFHGNYSIWGGDIDPACIQIAKANALRAGVENLIHFEVADARKFAGGERGTVLSNPPYGERVMERVEAEELYRAFGAAVRPLTDWKFYILSSHAEFEKNFGAKADKKRKLYNGMIKCDLYMYTNGSEEKK